MNYTSFSIQIISNTMLSIFKSKERNLSFVSMERSTILIEPFDEENWYYPEHYTNLAKLYRDIFEAYTMNLYEEINPDDLEFFYECQENVEQIIKDTTLFVYEFTDSFSKEQMLAYEDRYKELHPDNDNYWDFSIGTYYKTIKYDKKNTSSPWYEEDSLEMD